MAILNRLRRTVLGISVGETRVKRRGFRTTGASTASRLERIGAEFLGGYHAALEQPSCSALGLRLNADVPCEYRGFAFEGAAMALALLDHLRLTRHAFTEFLAGPGEPHAYMLHVGAGWAWARLPWVRRRPERALDSLDPLLRWLAVDGYGFHEGYFHWPASVRRHAVPAPLTGYARRAFDQGLGRSLWFVEGADPEAIGTTIETFPQPRRADLWSGVGLACAYAGGAGSASLLRLRKLAGGDAAAAAQGAAFASEARRRAGNPTEDCDLACQVLCGVPADSSADVALQEMRQLPPDGAMPAYEVWRRRIQQRFALQHQATDDQRISV